MTVAITLTVAPLPVETLDGFARTVTVSTAALPTEIITTLLFVVVVVVVGGVVPLLGVVVELPPAPPDVALTSATPESFPAKNIVVATPFRVCASTGSRRPSVVVNRTTVPFCTGVPLCSITVAETLDPAGFDDSASCVDRDGRLVGAISGTRSQLIATSIARTPRLKVMRVNIVSTIPNRGGHTDPVPVAPLFTFQTPAQRRDSLRPARTSSSASCPPSA